MFSDNIINESFLEDINFQGKFLIYFQITQGLFNKNAIKFPFNAPYELNK